jgi:hypothetical protein
VITIDDLDYIVRDVAFEGFVLNHYQNFGSSSAFCIFACRCLTPISDFNCECHPKWGIHW